MAQTTKVLFVSGELEEGVRFRNLFNAHFKGITFEHACDAAEALQLVEESGFALLIIDAALRVDELDEFFEEISRENDNYPTIFYGTEAFLKSRVPDNIYDFNMASGLLLRPLNLNDFISSINRSLAWVREKNLQEATVNLDASHFISFRVKNFYRFDQVAYPIFMQITEDKFIRIFEANEPYSHDKMSRYVKKGVRYLYFEKKDYLLFLSETMGKLRSILLKKDLAFELTCKAQSQACMIVQEYARAIGLNGSIIEFINLILESIKINYAKLNNIKKILVTFPYLERDVNERSVLTAYLSLALLQQLDWQSDLTFQKLGVAALFHDAFLENEELLNFSTIEDLEMQDEFEEEEIEQFKNHPLRAAEMLKFTTGLPECGFIISQHHERPDGRGYPQGVASHQITGIVAIFILASELSMQLAYYGISKKSLQMIIDDFYMKYNSGSFKEPFAHLSKMVTGKKS